MPTHARLDCVKCPSLCCRMAGYVRVSRDDIRRLAKHLALSVPEFEKRHIVETTKKGEKRIKEGFKSCQFLTEDRMCGVYSARPTDCRGYVCWNQEDETVSPLNSVHVPFLLKLPGQATGVLYGQSFNTVVSSRIITAILAGELKSPDGIAPLIGYLRQGDR